MRTPRLCSTTSPTSRKRSPFFFLVRLLGPAPRRLRLCFWMNRVPFGINLERPLHFLITIGVAGCIHSPGE
jgi:hypothetical protein